MREKIAVFVVIVLLISGISYGLYRVNSGSEKSKDGLDDYENLDLNRGRYNPTSEDLHGVVEGNYRFAFDLYKELNSSENMFYSPWSISSALAMTYEGAGGKTAQEMRDVFDFPENRSRLRESYGFLHDWYNSKNVPYNLSTANAAWVQEDYPVLKEYKNVLIDYYFSNVTNVDFVEEPSKACDMINGWVYNKTNGNIENIITEGDINRYTTMVLGNAIHFKGKWAKPFSENETVNRTFYTKNGEEVQTPFMRQEGEFNYTSTEDFKILQKKYAGDNMSMLFILPKEGDLDDLEGSLTASKLNDWREDLTSTSLKLVSIPKFDMSTSYSLKKPLKDLGMPRAFSSDANFSGIDGTEKLFIQFVKHKAFVEVDEKGTEASAATVVGIGRTSVDDRPSFVADSPFLFVIQDDVTGNVLFMGRMNDPTA